MSQAESETSLESLVVTVAAIRRAPDVAAWLQRALAIEATVQALQIADAGSLQRAVDELASIRAAVRAATDRRLEITRPIDTYKRDVLGLFGEVLQPLERAAQVLDARIVQWHRTQEAEARRQREERERLAREAEERERDAERLRREAARQAQQREDAPGSAAPATSAPAAEPATLGEYFEQLDNGGAPAPAPEPQVTLADAVAATQAALAARQAADQAAATPVVQPTRTVAGRAGSTATVTKRWAFRITDAAQVPRKYLVIDEAAIRRDMHAATTRDGRCLLEIPGVEFYQEEGTRSSYGGRR